MISDDEPMDWEARQALWDKYYKPNTNDWGIATRESPVRGVEVCQRCSALVDDTWVHLDWHTDLQGEDWER